MRKHRRHAVTRVVGKYALYEKAFVRFAGNDNAAVFPGLKGTVVDIQS
jgi:hypothetical protein